MGQLIGANQVNIFPTQGKMNEDSIENRFLVITPWRIIRTTVSRFYYCGSDTILSTLNI